MWAATMFMGESLEPDRGHGRRGNIRLLGIAHEPEDAARVAVDFLNWDLQANGADWALTVRPGGN